MCWIHYSYIKIYHFWNATKQHMIFFFCLLQLKASFKLIKWAINDVCPTLPVNNASFIYRCMLMPLSTRSWKPQKVCMQPRASNWCRREMYVHIWLYRILLSFNLYTLTTWLGLLYTTTTTLNNKFHQFVLASILVDFVKYNVMWILQIVDINRHLIWWICLTVKSMKIGAQRLMMLLQYMSNVWWIMIVH